jgi:hypothetical protein
MQHFEQGIQNRPLPNSGSGPFPIFRYSYLDSGK